MGCSPWGHKESDMTERLHFTSLQSKAKSTCEEKVNLEKPKPSVLKMILVLRSSRALCDSWAQSFSVSPVSLIIGNSLHSASKGSSLVAQSVKNLPAMQETWV